MRLSVAICTYNRAESLADTLEHICRQKIPSWLEWELLLVDNNCRDHTHQVAKSFLNRLPMRYMVEATQGLSHCRNRAMREAEGEALIYTDDDVRPAPGWLAAYVFALNEHSEAEYFGGPIVPYFPEGRPGWVRDTNMALVGGLFGTYDLGKQPHFYVRNEMHPYGANFAIRRSLFERLGLFRTDLGASGGVPGRGEEAEYFGRVRQAGVRGFYVPGASIQHRVEPSHMTLSYLYRFGTQKGIASRRIHGGSRRGSVYAEISYLVRGTYQLMHGRGDRFRQCVINMGIERGLRYP